MALSHCHGGVLGKHCRPLPLGTRRVPEQCWGSHACSTYQVGTAKHERRASRLKLISWEHQYADAVEHRHVNR